MLRSRGTCTVKKIEGPCVSTNINDQCNDEEVVFAIPHFLGTFSGLKLTWDKKYEGR